MQCMCKSSAASPQNGGQQQNGQNGNSGSQDGFARPDCVTKDFIACNTNAAQCEWSTDTYTITLNQAQNFTPNIDAGQIVTQTIGDKTITGTLKAALVGSSATIAITAKPGNTFFFKSSPIKINGITIAGSTGSNAIKSIESNGNCKSKCIAGKVYDIYWANKCKDCAIGRIRKEDTSSNECIICENGHYQDQVSCF